MASIFNQAKLVLIPSAVKAGKLYSVKDGDFTFSRNSVKNVKNKDGNLGEVAVNVPALEWVTDKYGVLIEPQRTNYFPKSNSFDSGWTVTNLVLGALGLSPDGTENAQLFTASTEVLLGTATAVLPNAEITSSFFYKNVNNEVLNFFITDNTVGQVEVTYFPLTNTFSAVFANSSWTNTSVNSEDIGNGWRRISLTATKSAGGNCTLAFNAFTASKSCYLYGFQIETGATASSYIVTNGATVTRLADVCTITPPEGTTQILEVVNGVENIILDIPETYTMPEGLISQVIMI